MTDVIKTLIDEGWKEYPEPTNNATRTVYADREYRVGLPDCECNEKPPSICVMHYSYPVSGNQFDSYEVSIRGELGGIWLKLDAYSLHGMAEVRAGIRQAMAAWVGVAISTAATKASQ